MSEYNEKTQFVTVMLLNGVFHTFQVSVIIRQLYWLEATLRVNVAVKDR